MPYASTYDEPGTFGGGENELVKLLIGRGVQRNRLRRLLLAKLIHDRRSEETDTTDDEWSEEEPTEDHRLARILVGSAMRKRRIRRLLLAKLIRDRIDPEAGGEEFEDEGSDDDHKLVRFMMARRVGRRAKLRRLLLAKLISERREEEGEGESFEDEDSDTDRQLVRFLLGARMMRRRRARGAILAKLLKERGEGEDEGEEFETEDEEPEGLGPVGKAAMFGAAKRRQRVRRAALAKVLADQEA